MELKSLRAVNIPEFVGHLVLIYEESARVKEVLGLSAKIS